MATFFNQASLSLNGEITNSNVTEGELLSALSITKTALNGAYGVGEELSYLITVSNNSSTERVFSITDDLGAYPVGGVPVYPLSYIDGSARLYINGVFSSLLTPVSTEPLSFEGVTLPAGAVATIAYTALATSYAPLEAGSVITNTASIVGTEESGESTVSVRDTVSLTIAKAICPSSVSGGGSVGYTFVIQNTGNTPVVSTDNLTVSDTFNPLLTDITVTLDGVELVEGVGYSYNELTGEFATLPGVVSVPAAVYTRDPVSGALITTPGNAVLTVVGAI